MEPCNVLQNGNRQPRLSGISLCRGNHGRVTRAFRDLGLVDGRLHSELDCLPFEKGGEHMRCRVQQAALELHLKGGGACPIRDPTYTAPVPSPGDVVLTAHPVAAGGSHPTSFRWIILSVFAAACLRFAVLFSQAKGTRFLASERPAPRAGRR